MTRMTGPDCAVMCNSINTHTHTHKHKTGNARKKLQDAEMRTDKTKTDAWYKHEARAQHQEGRSIERV